AIRGKGLEDQSERHSRQNEAVGNAPEQRIMDRAGPERGQDGQRERLCVVHDEALHPQRTRASSVWIFVNTAFRSAPTSLTEAMITTAISAAIRPYSMAVTPSSSRANFLID